MSFDPNKPVSLEEYNATLRSSVNSYYVHAMNDPSMSKEEAIKSSAEMSEKYLDSIQEFQEAQEMHNDTKVGVNEGIHSVELSGTQVDSNAPDTTGSSIVDTGTVDNGISGNGVNDDSSIDNGSDGVDDGMDI